MVIPCRYWHLCRLLFVIATPIGGSNPFFGKLRTCSGILQMDHFVAIASRDDDNGRKRDMSSACVTSVYKKPSCERGL